MQIRHVTQRHKSLQIEGHELTPESYYERSTRNWFRDGNERLFEIERIPIDGDQYLFAGCKGALQLSDYSNMATKAEIREHFQSLQEPLAAVARHRAKKLSMITLNTFSDIHAERELERLRRCL